MFSLCIPGNAYSTLCRPSVCSWYVPLKTINRTSLSNLWSHMRHFLKQLRSQLIQMLPQIITLDRHSTSLYRLWFHELNGFQSAVLLLFWVKIKFLNVNCKFISQQMSINSSTNSRFIFQNLTIQAYRISNIAVLCYHSWDSVTRGRLLNFNRFSFVLNEIS